MARKVTSFSLSEDHRDMLKKIQSKIGAKNTSEVIRTLIEAKYRVLVVDEACNTQEIWVTEVSPDKDLT